MAKSIYTIGNISYSGMDTYNRTSMRSNLLDYNRRKTMRKDYISDADFGKGMHVISKCPQCGQSNVQLFTPLLDGNVYLGFRCELWPTAHESAGCCTEWEETILIEDDRIYIVHD